MRTFKPASIPVCKILSKLLRSNSIFMLEAIKGVFCMNIDDKIGPFKTILRLFFSKVFLDLKPEFCFVSDTI